MIQFCNVTKEYRGNPVLKNLNMEIQEGELTVIIGPSGCGKTTTLKMINRLIPITDGKILIDGKDINEMDKVKMRRNIGYVIQQGGLFPHMTIKDNIEVIEKLEKKDPKKILEKTHSLMEMVDLDPEVYLDRYPIEMSGGQRQRIGVIRALANDPDIILFDEPFSALDPVTRSNLQDELMEMQTKIKKTMVFVTHDMDEAIKIADRICILKDGNIVQFDKTENILRNPANDFVKNFVGANRIWDSPQYIKVEDFMIKTPITCKGDMIRNRCVKRMRDHNIDSLIVVDDEKRIRGIVTRSSIFKATSPIMKAEEFMSKVRYVAHVGDNMVDVLKMIEESSVNSIPVIDKDEKLVGLLTNSKMVSTLSRKFLMEDNSEEEAIK
ncbi:MAG: Choline transport ATP-binding protein OpuBA [Peptostreptococcus russellii]|uniref:Quaternary amine transport ATP-binding protein n=1 Tax=Peptostreptococcus russellii TaxID=215200 RepID=A0A2P7PZP8_9FIRM|nr:betaine/proline/choline family ABC transporter ATP-binding protein [Peptostreptococcus russellii]PSJ31201.1 ABC transporter ATPase [Peptostreptococcus russellii]